MKVINLSDLDLTPDHINLLQKDIFFSPVANMDEFTLFLRKVFFRSLYTKNDNAIDITEPFEAEDQRALDILNSLLDENDTPNE